MLFATLAAWGQPIPVESNRLRAHIRFLASDLLEGRSVGVRGGQLATQYIASALEAAGAKPAGDHQSFFQNVPLTGILVDSGAKLRVGTKQIHWRTHFVGTTQTQEAHLDFNAPLVFVGHGIHAPEFQWNDYEGVDVKGKIVVLFTGEPPSNDPAFFGGKALTYYGRWTYKFEEAARQGAAGAIIIHTPETASYAWSVVENSWGREDIQLRREAGQPALRLAAWMQAGAAQELGFDVPALLARADTKGFRAEPFGQTMAVSLRATIRQIESQNVVARVEGSDPDVAAETILYSSHWDHLGEAAAGADRIFNGAVDNATGCAALIEIARSWASLSPRPRRSALFVFVTAEESGLRGSEYYVRHPLVPLSATRLNINIDAIVPGGKPEGLMVHGKGTPQLWSLVEGASKRYGVPLREDPRPESGSEFRSDHFSFVRAGVAAYSLVPVGVPGAFSMNYGAKHYHQPSDEYSPDWDMTSNQILANLALLLGVNAASLP